jgi:two-component system nitrate/nitrite response regulator NarL
MDERPVLVADGDRIFRSAISALLKRAGVAAITASTGDEAVDAARDRRPAVVVLDVGLRDRSGYETCRALREMYGEMLPILFVSAERTTPYDLVAGLLIGGDDYVAKPADLDELLARIVRAQRRGGDVSADSAATGEINPPLTARELEILRMVAAGRAPRDIATQLVISPKTVSSHLQRVLSKLSVHSRAQAISRAYELGLVHAPKAD